MSQGKSSEYVTRRTTQFYIENKSLILKMRDQNVSTKNMGIRLDCSRWRIGEMLRQWGRPYKKGESDN